MRTDQEGEQRLEDFDDGRALVDVGLCHRANEGDGKGVLDRWRVVPGGLRFGVLGLALGKGILDRWRVVAGGLRFRV